jgi:hypothetical protein
MSSTSSSLLKTSAGWQSPLSSVRFARIVPSEALSERPISLIQQWIRQCLTEHADCKVYKGVNLPSRIIDVGTNAKDPRIHISYGEQGSYFALSYCWGECLPLKMTSASLDSMKLSIPLARFPKTIRDAVMVTRACGIPYLWVDALCIMQDSREDWVRESARMGSIYANALSVIIADAAIDCNSGFLTTRKDYGRQNCLWLHFQNEPPGWQTVLMRKSGSQISGTSVHALKQSQSRL